MAKITVITPVWNQSHLTNSFLAQNYRTFCNDPFVFSGTEWIIINNGSTDNTSQVLSVRKPDFGENLKIIDLPQNIGFGPANNKGFDMATGDIIIFMSNDVQVLGDYITPTFAAIEKNPNVLYGAEIFDHNTGWNTFRQTGPIPYVAGWCVACTSDIWAIVGPWDERYVPCDYEDIDLSYAAQIAKIPINKLNLPLHHQSGKSASEIPGGRVQVTLANQKRFMDKWGLTFE